MIDLKEYEVWFITGSQHLYGPETLKQVDADSKQIAEALDASAAIPCKVVFKPVLKTPDEITKICVKANTTPNCIGLIAWMHTFSPAKMWIAGLSTLQKPFVHLHTQFNRDLPWDKIDMDFMNLNQSAHGDREFGFICTRLRKNRKVIVGHWKEADVQQKLGIWMRAAAGWNEMRSLKVARFGDNMREVAVTEGDKVEAQKQFGISVNGYGVGDLVAVVNKVADSQIDKLVAEYKDCYKFRVAAEQMESVREAARIEAGLRAFLEKGGFKAFTTTFEDLHGLKQLPGLAVQRLMAEGYGFGAEGDWKTAALVRAMKVMAAGLKGGTSFMEDYTYHLDPKGMKVLGAHMLEVCSTIASGKPSLEVHPLGIGGKADPVRVVFTAAPGAGLNASLIDMGNRFRMIVNTVDVVKPDADLPNLPVARVVWVPRPNLKTAAAAWILAGGAHHTGFSTALTAEHMEDFTEMAGIEYLLIDENTQIPDFKRQMRTNEVYYMLAGSLR
ncbi:MAG TPA: L-arabinose isomerase [Anaerohalosphaeraceae bacterium]|nr:L-arabinose isomerase [Phycisphaerae bacterium]HOL31247.1 L-arabinose isomerase [Anaerohalosphaeraceae bacterium]HOM75024.1 L-arabinose isomerase [Anaerohalosphaeraceae bacterium]HPC63638.1 L-arabinose isomerase [Anaerohalosphaeraceae bacterium]HRS71216.1 L-arabinose isomerase [Anaerohalosphaeraceae bacterium]